MISLAYQSTTDDFRAVLISVKDRYFTYLQKEMCCPANTEGWNLGLPRLLSQPFIC